MRRLVACLALVVVVGFAGPAFAEKRVALVVGNSAYRSVTPLDNPTNDAALVAETLKGLGFTLTGNGARTDLDKAALDQAIQDFGRQIQGADVAMFYYAGHGVQVRGSNYLVPVNANPTREADVDFQMVDVNLVLNQMNGSGTRLNLVILDACRNNPFGGRGLRSSEGGLAQLRAPEGTLISYATQPGNVAQDGSDGHSPYTKALSVTMKRAGLDVFQTFNQVGLTVKRSTGGSQQPWVSSSPIDGSFYFTPAASSAASPVPDKPQPELPPTEPQRQEARLTEPGQSLSPDTVTDCDRLAGNYSDPMHARGIAGVRPNLIDIVPALAACNAAISQYPGVARFTYQAGRVATSQKDYVVARQLFEKAADAGYPASYLNLGLLYYQGNGVPKDYAEARKWYEKAVAANDAAAMNALGYLYELGNGAPKDPVEARKWYEKAAASGVSAAMVNLGRFYRDGIGVTMDPGQARTWFQRAAAANDPSGMTALGFLYERGVGVPQDPVQEKKWYERAAALGDANAMNGLGWLYDQGNGVTRDYTEARKWYEKAAALDHFLAMTNLGNLYRDGHGVPQDYSQARAWFEKSAAGGRTYAMMRLGDFYLQGLGVTKDPVRARKWYDMAAAAGDPNAPKAISEMNSGKKN
jgi:TPR repeat protein